MPIKSRVDERRSNSNVEVYARIGKIETEQASILTSLDGLSKVVGDLAKEIHEIKDGSKTNWATLASWASLIVILMSVIGTLAISPIIKMLDYHMEKEGHIETITKEARLEEKVENLKEQVAYIYEKRNCENGNIR